jgi:fructuronate reductase
VPSDVDALLHRKEIFGVDLFEAGLAGKVKEYFAKLNSGKGSVRKLLKEI